MEQVVIFLQLICFILCDSTTKHIRATWIPVQYFNQINQTSFSKLHDIGINRIYIDVWNNGNLYFNSSTYNSFITNTTNTIEFDALQTYIPFANEYKIETYAWFEYGLMACYSGNINVNNSMGNNTLQCASNNQFYNSIIKHSNNTSNNTSNNSNNKNEWIAGDYNGFIWLNASNVNVLNFLSGLISDCIENYSKIGLKGVQFDDHFACPNGLNKYTDEFQKTQTHKIFDIDNIDIENYKILTNSNETNHTNIIICNETVMNNGIDYIYHRLENILQNFNITFSLSPATFDFSLNELNVNVLLWMKQQYFNQFVPQLYYTSFKTFKNELDSEMKQIYNNSYFIKNISDIIVDNEYLSGIRIDGTGASTNWTDVRNMTLYANNNYSIGVCMWYCHGLIDTYFQQFENFWGI